MNNNQSESRKLTRNHYDNSHDKIKAKCGNISQCWLFSKDLSDIPPNFAGKDCPNCGIYQEFWYWIIIYKKHLYE